MATNYWILATGSGDWNAGGNWSLGAAPVNTNDVVINFGNATIDTSLAQSAVTLASIVTGPNFSGSIGGSSVLPLHIGVSGNLIINSPNSTQIVIDVGTTTPTIDVIATGQNSNSPPILGQESLILQGGGSGCTLSMAGPQTNVGIATQSATTTAQIDTMKINGGFLNVNSGVTTTTIIQSNTNGGNNNGVLTVLSAATTIAQNGLGCNLVTGGTGKITTITVTGNAILGNRPASGAAWDTIIIGPQAQVDCSEDPRAATVTNAIVMAAGSSFTAFNAAQITKVSTGILTIAPQTTGVGNPGATVNVGNVATATFA